MFKKGFPFNRSNIYTFINTHIRYFAIFWYGLIFANLAQMAI